MSGAQTSRSRYAGPIMPAWHRQQFLPDGSTFDLYSVDEERPRGPEWSAALTEPQRVTVQFARQWDYGRTPFNLVRVENGTMALRAWCDRGEGHPGAETLDIADAVELGLVRVLSPIQAELMAWRAERGLSQADLARLLPAPVRTIENWESDVSNPPAYLRRALADLARELDAERTS